MTSEILIMNKDCAAIAADSAATLNGPTPKIYEINKVFALSKKYPVGLMMYQNPLISGVPVETIVKEYRKYGPEDELGTIEGYGERLLMFIENGYPATDGGHIPIISEKLMEANVRRCLYSLWSEVIGEMEEHIGNKVKDGLENESKEEPIRVSLSPNKMIANIISERKKEERTPRQIKKPYIKKVESGLNEIFAMEHFREVMSKISYPISAEPYLEDLKAIFQARLLSEEPFWDTTGIVISGFGLNQTFPAYIEYNIDGCFWGKLKYSERSKGEITEDVPAIIKTFAQGDVAETFLRGMAPDIRKRIISEFRNMLAGVYSASSIQAVDGIPITSEDTEKAKELVLGDFISWLDMATYRAYEGPIVRSVAFLSKKEISQMAESMINLTSLRRRVSADSVENVGGPADVAIISKGDGLIWVNRKHYFDIALNPHYDGTK